MKLLDNWKNAFGHLEAEGMAVLREVEADETSFLEAHTLLMCVNTVSNRHAASFLKHLLW